MKDKFDFIYSPRFLQLFLVGLAVGLNFPFPNNPWVQGFSAMIGIWFGGSVTIGTFDKAGDKKIEAAKVSASTTTVSMPASVSSVTATTKE